MCRSFLLPTSTRGVLDKYKDSVRRREGGREGEKEGRTHLFDPIWSSSLSWITFTTSKLQNMKLP